MSENSLFGKVEALMRKHRGDVASELAPAARLAPSPDAWLPVLTDVVQRGTPPSVLAEHDDTNDTPVADSAPTQPEPEHTDAAIHDAPVHAAPESLHTPEPAHETEAEADAPTTENMVDELTPKITGLLHDQISEQLRNSLNQSMVSLMTNLSANVEEIVRQAVAEKLAENDKKP